MRVLGLSRQNKTSCCIRTTPVEAVTCQAVFQTRWAPSGAASGPASHPPAQASADAACSRRSSSAGSSHARHQCTSRPSHHHTHLQRSHIRPDMSLVSGPGRAGAGAANMPAEMHLFVDRHVAYIQSLDTVRTPKADLAAQAQRGPMGHGRQSNPALTRSSAKTSSSTGLLNTCASTASTGG